MIQVPLGEVSLRTRVFVSSVFLVARMNVSDYKIAKLLKIGLNSKMKVVAQPSIFGLHSLHTFYNIYIYKYISLSWHVRLMHTSFFWWGLSR